MWVSNILMTETPKYDVPIYIAQGTQKAWLIIKYFVAFCIRFFKDWLFAINKTA